MRDEWDGGLERKKVPSCTSLVENICSVPAVPVSGDILLFDADRVLSTDHELIPARNASLAAVHGSASGSNVRYYPT
jgi:hypothetical protein